MALRPDEHHIYAASHAKQELQKNRIRRNNACTMDGSFQLRFHKHGVRRMRPSQCPYVISLATETRDEGKYKSSGYFEPGIKKLVAEKANNLYVIQMMLSYNNIDLKSDLLY
jgi:hypothetical protein